MRRFELGFDMNYVSDWGIVEAVREISQNVLDEEIENGHEMFWSYDDITETLVMGNKGAKLESNSLLLGSSSKGSNDKLIGRHGEGYKVATVVLLRNNCSIKIHNGCKEDWVATIVKSRRYGTNIPAFDVVRSAREEGKVVYTIGGISKDVFEEIKSKNFIFVEPESLGEMKHTKYGDLLLDKRFKGKVYISGLYVCNKQSLEFGYNFKPQMLKLDRDRGLVDSFDLQFATGKLLSEIEDVRFLYGFRNCWDMSYIHIYLKSDDKSNSLYDMCFDGFTKEFGEDAIPCATQYDFNSYRKLGYNSALVTKQDMDFISKSSKFLERGISPLIDLDELFKRWCNKVEGKLSEEELLEITNLWSKVKGEI